MSISNANILKRKIEAGSIRQAKASLQNSLVKNLETSIGKVFLDILGVEVRAIVSGSTVTTQKTTIKTMTSNLFGIVSFDDEIGLSGFNTTFVNSIISLLTLGRSEKADPRSVTSSDAAMVRYIINKILTDVFENYQAADDDLVQMSEYETVKAPLTYLLNSKKYALLTIGILDVHKFDIGAIELAIPLTYITKTFPIDALPSDKDRINEWAETMATIVAESPIELDAIVQRMNVPLGKILKFKAGDLLDLTDGSLATLTLDGQTSTGPTTTFTGQLGALKSNKAFKVARIIDEEYRLF